MQIRSLRQARELLDSSMLHKGFYDVSSVEALLEYTQWLQSRLDEIQHRLEGASIELEYMPSTLVTDIDECIRL